MPRGRHLPTVTISGPAAVTAGSTHAYRLTITGGPAVVGGFNVSTEAGIGALSPGGSDVQLITGELTHTAPKPFSAGSVSFDFLWTAPASNDTVTFYGAGNSTNGNGELTGDGVAATVFDVTVSGSSGTPAPTATPPANPVGGKLVWRTVAAGLDRPIDIQNAGDDRLFVAEQTGRIRIVQPDGAVRGTPFLDLSGQIQPPDSNGENGLLGLTFAPDYAQSKRFFVYYSVQSQGELRAHVLALHHQRRQSKRGRSGQRGVHPRSPAAKRLPPRRPTGVRLRWHALHRSGRRWSAGRPG